jgi:hypothetical protein
MSTNPDQNTPQEIWQHQSTEIPHMTALALKDKAARLEAEASRRSRMLSAVLLFNVTLFLVLTFVFPHPVERVGCVLTAAGWLVVFERMRRAGLESARRAASDPADATAVNHQRSLLEQERRRAAAWPWLIAAVPGPVVFIAGTTLQFPELRRGLYFALTALGVLVVGSVLRQVMRERQYRDLLQELAVFERSGQ